MLLSQDLFLCNFACKVKAETLDRLFNEIIILSQIEGEYVPTNLSQPSSYAAIYFIQDYYHHQINNYCSGCDRHSNIRPASWRGADG